MMKVRAAVLTGAPSLLLVVVLLVSAGAGPLAQSPGVVIQPPRAGGPLQENEPRSWFRNYDYGVEIDGRREPGVGLYQVVGKPYMLLFGPGLETPWVLTLREKEVRPVKASEITIRSEMEVVLAESSFLSAAPEPWVYDGETAVVFYCGSPKRRVRVARVPPVEGETTVEHLYEVNPLYKMGKDKYVPDQSAIARLKKVASPYLIEVWFGSWCPHCQRVVPRFIKVMEATANPNVQVVYHGVPRDFTSYKPAQAREVEGLPTFIVLKNGREYRRLRGAGEKVSLEEELADLLSPAGGG